MNNINNMVLLWLQISSTAMIKKTNNTAVLCKNSPNKKKEKPVPIQQLTLDGPILGMDMKRHVLETDLKNRCQTSDKMLNANCSLIAK